MILTGPEISRQVALGAIEIDPFVAEHVNPASVDLTLGDDVVTYRRLAVLDSRIENAEHRFKIEDSIVLVPGELYLMHTAERVCTREFVPVIDGKSSLGRLGVSVHVTAGYGDPGFDGQWTLEVTCVLPVRVYAGMRFAQMRFHTVHGELRQYAGNYADDVVRGPVPSRSWRQFK